MIETLSTAADIIMAAAAASEKDATAAAVTTAEFSAPEIEEDSTSTPTSSSSKKKTVDDADNLVPAVTTAAPAASLQASGIREMSGTVPSQPAPPSHFSSFVSAPSTASIIAAAQRAAVLAGVGSANRCHPSTVGVGDTAVADGTQHSSLLIGHHIHHHLQLSAGEMAAVHHHNHLAGAVTDVSAAAPSSYHHLMKTSEKSSTGKSSILPAPSLQGRRGPPKKRNAAAAALARDMDLNITSVSSSSVGTAATSIPTPQPAGDATTSGDSASSQDVAHAVVKSAQQAAITEDEKKAERRAANRRSAFQSRQRRKILIEDLQRTVAALSKDNADLRSLNQDLQQQLEVTLIENQQLQAKIGVTTKSAPLDTATVGGVSSVATSTPFGHESAAAIESAARQQAQAKAEAHARAIAEVQAAHAAKIAAEQEQQLIRARLQLMAAQNRVSELEYQHQHHPSVGTAWNATAAPPRVVLSDAAASSRESFPGSLRKDKHGGTEVGGAAKNGSPSAAAQAHLARLQELQNIRIMLAANKVGNTGGVGASEDGLSSAGSQSVYLSSDSPSPPSSTPFVGNGPSSIFATSQNPVSVTTAPPDADSPLTTTQGNAANVGTKTAVVSSSLSVTSPANGATLPPTPNNTPAATLPLSSAVTCTSAPSSSLTDAPGLHLLLQSLKAKTGKDHMDDRPTNSDVAMDSAV